MTEYACIQIDSPWPETGGGGRGAQDHYDVIRDRSDILRTIVTAPCWRPAADAHLWSWTTMTSLIDGLWLVDALGFRYVTHAVWAKTAATRDLWTRARDDAGFKVNNDYRAVWVRRLIAEHPELSSMFETRRRRAA